MPRNIKKSLNTPDEVKLMKKELREIAELKAKAANIPNDLATKSAFGKIDMLNGPTNEPQSLKELLFSHKKELAKLATTKGEERLELKAPVTMLLSNATPVVPGAPLYSSFENDPQWHSPHSFTLIRTISQTRMTDKAFITFSGTQNLQGGFVPTSEGTLKNLSSFDLKEGSVRVQKVSAFLRVSKEILADTVDFQENVEEELRQLAEEALDRQLYSGNGTIPNLWGVSVLAKPFDVSATPFALAIDNADLFSVLAVSIALIAADGYAVTHALVNPGDLALAMTKTTTAGAIVHPLMPQLGNLIIVPSPSVPAGSFTIGDFTKYRPRIRSQFNLSIGNDSTSFLSNCVIVEGEIRANAYIKPGEEKAFRSGNLATALAAIEKP